MEMFMIQYSFIRRATSRVIAQRKCPNCITVKGQLTSNKIGALSLANFEKVLYRYPEIES